MLMLGGILTSAVFFQYKQRVLLFVFAIVMINFGLGKIGYLTVRFRS